MKFEKVHEKVFSGSPSILGNAHLIILKAVQIKNKQFPSSNKDHIHWWIYEMETDHDELLEKTEKLRETLEKLFLDTMDLKHSTSPVSYSSIVQILEKFSERHKLQIQSFFNYVEWLKNKRNPVAPVILFSSEGWENDKMSDWFLPIPENDEPNAMALNQCIELVMGLRSSHGITKYLAEYELKEKALTENNPLGYKNDDINSMYVDKKDLLELTWRYTIDNFIFYVEKIRDSLNKIRKTIAEFSKESFVIRTITIQQNIRPKRPNGICFGLAQLNYTYSQMPDQFGLEPDEEEELKKKIISAINLAKENLVDILAFPELCFKKEWVKDIELLSRDLIIIGGSYYENSSNICPVFVNGVLIKPYYKKVFPSSFEKIEIDNQCMLSGKFIYLYKTTLGIFSVLTCIDFEQTIHSIMSDKKKHIDFIINPCYDYQISRFQQLANSICENKEITIIQVNRSEDKNGKFGCSGVLSREHDSIIGRLTSSGLRSIADPKFLLARSKGEELLVAKINFEIKSPPRPLPGDYPGRINNVGRFPLG
jgi:predicted amidohydrolase